MTFPWARGLPSRGGGGLLNHRSRHGFRVARSPIDQLRLAPETQACLEDATALDSASSAVEVDLDGPLGSDLLLHPVPMSASPQSATCIPTQVIIGRVHHRISDDFGGEGFEIIA